MVETRRPQLMQPFEQLIPCPHQAGRLDQSRGHKALLLWEHPAIMAGMDALVETLLGHLVQHRAVVIPNIGQKRRG